MKKFALVIAALTVIFGFGATAHAYPPAAPDVSVSNPNPDPGGSFTVTVTGCQPNEVVDVTFNGASDTATADANGDVTINLNAPNDPGTYNGSVTCNGQTTNFSVTVLAPTQPTTPSGGLPATGSDGTSTTLYVAIGALVLGLGLFGATQARRRQTVDA